jgi:nucleoid DNA-binding protein
MDILSYLLELLQQRKEVGITGLGTFYKKKYPGRYDKEKQTFLPPGYTLQFSTDLTEEEALIDFISAKRNISNDSAKSLVEQFVEEVNQKLELNHEVELENTGRLFFTEQGISFEAVKNMNYGSEFYGLPSLAETAVEEVKPTLPNGEEIYDEIAEAPVAPSPFENKSYQVPVIENVELDEVKDDLKNTLKHSEDSTAEIVEAPDFIKEQHEQHPERFGHTPESEVENNVAEQQAIEIPEPVNAQEEADTTEEVNTAEVENIAEEQQAIETPEPVDAQEEADTTEEVEVPESIVTQHEEHPNRFGHTPESEVENIAAEHQAIETPESDEADTVENESELAVPESVIPQQKEQPSRFSLRSETEEPKTYINLEDEAKQAAPVIEAPEFIKEQHAEHPNRFGHDPIEHREDTPQAMSTWLMITIAILALVIIAAITYLVKPELFTGQTTEPVKAAQSVIDSPKVAVDTLKAKQDSIAKTDSILKANQVQKKADTVKKAIVKPVEKPVVALPVETPKEKKIVPNTGPSTFYVIAASFQSEKKALVFIKQMEKIGLKAEIAKVPGRLKKVSIASFTTEKEAKKEKDILEKRLKGKGYFVQQESNNTQP